MRIRDANDVYRPGKQSLAEWHLDAMARRTASTGHLARVYTSTLPLNAYVNDNRWIVDCPCGAGNAVELDTSSARCGECGAHHTAVNLPLELETITVALEARPPGRRNWYPGETTSMLIAENRAHGIKS